MTKIKIEVEFEVDDSLWGANSEDQDERDWFWKEILPGATLILHSNEVGDEIASTNNFTVKETVPRIDYAANAYLTRIGPDEFKYSGNIFYVIKYE